MYKWRTIYSSGISKIVFEEHYHIKAEKAMAPTPVLLPGKSHGWRSLVGCSPWGREESDTTERLHFTFHFHELEKEMATHSSVLAWRIPATGEPGGLPMGSPRVGHNWSDLAVAAAAYWRWRHEFYDLIKLVKCCKPKVHLQSFNILWVESDSKTSIATFT